jgi:sialate O-acetylesterase
MQFRRLAYLLLLAVLPLGHSILANVTLPAIFGDHMVLQQNQTVQIWGWGKPGEAITLSTTWSSEQLKTTVSNQGLWSLQLATPKGGMATHQITLKGFNEVVLKNVQIGEVWLCSGQSNMEWTANLGINNAQEEVKLARHPNIRFFTVEHRTATSPQIDLRGQWEVCSPASMQNFSAVAYFFARKLQKELNVPVGLINSSWGGTPAEAWMPAEAFAGNTLITEAAKTLKSVPWGPVEMSRIYNAMIEPIIRFKIAGALWYQGESNVGTAYAYKETLSALIKSWRQKWEAEFPFYFCQIAPYKYSNPGEGAALRDAQRRTLELPLTGMVVTSDIGDTSDIHPRNKQDVGLRLANLALSNHYKFNTSVVMGPLYKNMELRGNQVWVYFDNAGGLHYKGAALTHFELAGEDGVFYPAQARFNAKNIVEVQSERVPKPSAVRYAWSNTATPNLFNSAGLPASCFTSK